MFKQFKFFLLLICVSQGLLFAPGQSSSSGVAQELCKDQFKCFICWELYSHSCYIPCVNCDHGFCIICTDKMARFRISQCPLCRRSMENVDGVTSLGASCQQGVAEQLIPTSERTAAFFARLSDLRARLDESERLGREERAEDLRLCREENERHLRVQREERAEDLRLMREQHERHLRVQREERAEDLRLMREERAEDLRLMGEEHNRYLRVCEEQAERQSKLVADASREQEERFRLSALEDEEINSQYEIRGEESTARDSVLCLFTKGISEIEQKQRDAKAALEYKQFVEARSLKRKKENEEERLRTAKFQMQEAALVVHDAGGAHGLIGESEKSGCLGAKEVGLGSQVLVDRLEAYKQACGKSKAKQAEYLKKEQERVLREENNKRHEPGASNCGRAIWCVAVDNYLCTKEGRGFAEQAATVKNQELPKISKQQGEAAASFHTGKVNSSIKTLVVGGIIGGVSGISVICKSGIDKLCERFRKEKPVSSQLAVPCKARINSIARQS